MDENESRRRAALNQIKQRGTCAYLALLLHDLEEDLTEVVVSGANGGVRIDLRPSEFGLPGDVREDLRAIVLDAVLQIATRLEKAAKEVEP